MCCAGRLGNLNFETYANFRMLSKSLQNSILDTVYLKYVEMKAIGKTCWEVFVSVWVKPDDSFVALFVCFPFPLHSKLILIEKYCLCSPRGKYWRPYMKNILSWFCILPHPWDRTKRLLSKGTRKEGCWRTGKASGSHEGLQYKNEKWPSVCKW